MSERTAKILIGLVGIFCFLLSLISLPEHTWGRDCLQVGEDSVLEHLKQQGWSNLKVFSNESLELPREREMLADKVFLGMAIVIGELKGKEFMLRVGYGSRILYHGSGGSYCEVSVVEIDKKVSMDMDW